MKDETPKYNFFNLSFFCSFLF